jgi:hypothetical protein
MGTEGGMDADFPWAVDIPIPPAGLGPLLPLILDAAQSCDAGAVVTTCSEARAGNGEVRRWFNRILTRCPEDAHRIAHTFRSIGARRVGT